MIALIDPTVVCMSTEKRGWLIRVSGLFFSIWTFTSMKICPKVYKFFQSRFNILPISKWTLEKLPKTLKILPKWRNFAKSGHTPGYPRYEEVSGCTIHKTNQPRIIYAVLPHKILFASVIKRTSLRCWMKALASALSSFGAIFGSSLGRSCSPCWTLPSPENI